MMTTISAQALLGLYDKDYLKNVSTLGALSDDALMFLLEQGDILQPVVGERLFSYEDPVDSFYVVLDGQIDFYKPCRNGRTLIRQYHRGMEIGFVAMIGLHGRAGDADAGPQPTYLLRVSTGLFSDLQQKMPNDFGILLLNLAREMSRRLREADIRLAELE